MLRIVEAIIGLELCEQSCAEQAAQCQGKFARVRPREAPPSEPVISEKITPPPPHDLSTPPRPKWNNENSSML